MITLFYDNKILKISELGFIVSPDFKIPSSGDFDRNLQYIPGRYTPWDFGVQQKGLKITIPCKSISNSQREFQESINKFNSFVLDNEKSPRILKMKLDTEPDKYYNVQLEGPFIPTRKRVKEFTLEFFAGDSNKYAKSDEYDPDHKIVYGQVEKGDYYSNTQTFHWLYNKHYSGIYNYSSYTTKIKIIIVGTVKNGRIKHSQSGKTLTFPDVTNGRVVLDGNNKTVEKNGNDTLVGSNYNFFDLTPGDNSFTFEGDITNARVTFEWLHRF